MVADMKTTVSWFVPKCSLVEIDGRFRGAYCLHHQDDDGPDDGGNKHCLNVGQFLPDYTAQHPRRRLSSTLTSTRKKYAHKIRPKYIWNERVKFITYFPTTL
jgi:hypothetical protein